MDLDLDDSTLSFDSRLLFDDVLVVFQASPLVWEAPDHSLHPIHPQLPLQKFKQELHYALASTKLRIRIDFEIGTKTTLENFLRSSRARLVHISCPCQDDSLMLESDSGTGTAASLEADQIISILKSRKHSFQYVFCPSMPVARAFLAAGVSHVILCKLDDNHTTEFCNFLYTVLAEGKSIQEAVQTAKDLVKHNISDMVQLLPEDGDHGSGPLFVAQPTLPPPLSCPDANDRIPKHGEISMPSGIFVGRQQLMFDMIRAEERFVHVTGAGGSGKTALVGAVCHYMMERRSMFSQEFVWLPSPFGDSDVDTVLSTGTHVLQNIMDKEEESQPTRTLFGILRNQKSEDSVEVESLKGDADLRMRDKMESMLVARNTIMVVDFREAKSQEAGDELFRFLLGLFAACRHLRAIVISETQGRSLGFPSRLLSSRGISQVEFHVKPLGYTSTVTLFGMACPFVRKGLEETVSSVQTLKDLMIPSEGYQGSNDKVKKTLVQLHQLMGGGIPHAIVEKATRIDKAGYKSLIQLAELRQKLSQGSPKDAEGLQFSTRFQLDVFLRNTSESIEACRRNRNTNGTQAYEVVYHNFEQQRHSKLPSVESMLIKRKSLRQEILLAEASEETTGLGHMKEELRALEKSITLERRMSEGDNSYDESFLVNTYPHGVTRVSLDRRIATLDWERQVADQRSQFYRARELESAVRELRARSCDLYPMQVLRERLVEIGRDPDHKLGTMVGQEMEKAHLQTVAEDFFVPTYAVLYWKGDQDAISFLPEGQFSSRFHLDQCLDRIRIEIERTEDRVDVFRQNKLVEIYNSVLDMRKVYPSLEALLIQRKGLFLEMRLVCSMDEEITKPYEEQIEELEKRVLVEREELGEASSFAGVWKEFYNFGLTRALLEKRIEQFTKEHDCALAKSRVVDAIDLNSRIGELKECRAKLPTSQEYDSMIAQQNGNLELLQKRDGNHTKYAIVANAVEELEQQKWAEDNTSERRVRSIISNELFAPDLDYMSDCSSLGDSAVFVHSFIENSGFKVSAAPSLSKLEELSDRQLDELGMQIEEEKSKLNSSKASQLSLAARPLLQTLPQSSGTRTEEADNGKTLEACGLQPAEAKSELECTKGQTHRNVILQSTEQNQERESGTAMSESESDSSGPVGPEPTFSESEINVDSFMFND